MEELLSDRGGEQRTHVPKKSTAAFTPLYLYLYLGLFDFKSAQSREDRNSLTQTAARSSLPD